MDALEEQNTAKVIAKLLKLEKEKEEWEKREKEEMRATGVFVELVQAKGLSPLFKSGTFRFLYLCLLIHLCVLVPVCLTSSAFSAYFQVMLFSKI